LLPFFEVEAKEIYNKKSTTRPIKKEKNFCFISKL